MEKINEAVSKNLREIRASRHLSLDALAKMTDVSKSMLAQIERGDANPTITTLWKIANGLKVSFTQLITRPEQDFEVVTREQQTALLEDGGRFRNYPLFPYDSTRQFELLTLELEPGSFMQAEAHPADTQEFVTVFSGVLEVQVADRTLEGRPGDAMRFKADFPHSYRNVSQELCRLSVVIYYGK